MNCSNDYCTPAGESSSAQANPAYRQSLNHNSGDVAGSTMVERRQQSNITTAIGPVHAPSIGSVDASLQAQQESVELRCVSEIIPRFDQLHMHIKKHLVRHGASSSVVVVKESKKHRHRGCELGSAMKGKARQQRWRARENSEDHTTDQASPTCGSPCSCTNDVTVSEESSSPASSSSPVELQKQHQLNGLSSPVELQKQHQLNGLHSPAHEHVTSFNAPFYKLKSHESDDNVCDFPSATASPAAVDNELPPLSSSISEQAPQKKQNVDENASHKEADLNVSTNGDGDGDGDDVEVSKPAHILLMPCPYPSPVTRDDQEATEQIATVNVDEEEEESHIEEEESPIKRSVTEELYSNGGRRDFDFIHALTDDAACIEPKPRFAQKLFHPTDDNSIDWDDYDGDYSSLQTASVDLSDVEMNPLDSPHRGSRRRKNKARRGSPRRHNGRHSVTKYFSNKYKNERRSLLNVVNRSWHFSRAAVDINADELQPGDLKLMSLNDDVIFLSNYLYNCPIRLSVKNKNSNQGGSENADSVYKSGAPDRDFEFCGNGATLIGNVECRRVPNATDGSGFCSKHILGYSCNDDEYPKKISCNIFGSSYETTVKFSRSKQSVSTVSEKAPSRPRRLGKKYSLDVRADADEDVKKHWIENAYNWMLGRNAEKVDKSSVRGQLFKAPHLRMSEMLKETSRIASKLLPSKEKDGTSADNPVEVVMSERSDFDFGSDIASSFADGIHSVNNSEVGENSDFLGSFTSDNTARYAVHLKAASDAVYREAYGYDREAAFAISHRLLPPSMDEARKGQSADDSLERQPSHTRGDLRNKRDSLDSHETTNNNGVDSSLDGSIENRNREEDCDTTKDSEHDLRLDWGDVLNSVDGGITDEQFLRIYGCKREDFSFMPVPEQVQIIKKGRERNMRLSHKPMIASRTCIGGQQVSVP